MKKLFYLIVLLVSLAFSVESRTMRIGESQYFDTDGDSKQDVKITLVDVQNGVATLKRESLKANITEVQYFYAAPGSEDPVAPIVLQPYPSTVYTENITISGIFEAGQKIYLFKTSEGESFDKKKIVTTVAFERNGSNFSVNIPLKMGKNLFYVGYGENVVGKRALIEVTRLESSNSAMNADLDPIGSDDVRTTAIWLNDLSLGEVRSIETVAGKETGSSSQIVSSEGSLSLKLKNTKTNALERNFHISFFDNGNTLKSQETVSVFVNENAPVLRMVNPVDKFTSKDYDLVSLFTDDNGVRFAWARILDSEGKEISRGFVDIGSRLMGGYEIKYASSESLDLKAYGDDNSILGTSTLSLPKNDLFDGKNFVLELGVTDVSGNRSNVYSTTIVGYAYEKIFDISLLDAVPQSDITYYPMLLRITDDDVDFSTMQDFGDDIRFVDENGNLLNFEIERISKKLKQAEIWVRIPKIEAFSTRVRVKMLWGNDDAESPIGKYVWDDGFRGVYHFTEKNNGVYIPENTIPDYMVYTAEGIDLMERSQLNGNVASSGMINLGQNAEINGSVSEKIALQEMVIDVEASPGIKNVSLSNGGRVTLLPGKYGLLEMDSRSKVYLSAGVYHFKKISMATDTKIYADISSGLVFVKVQESMTVAERASVELNGGSDASMVRFDVSGNSVSFGTDVSWKGVMTAPQANVDIKERMDWTGSLFARYLKGNTDVSFSPVIMKKNYTHKIAAKKDFPPRDISEFGLFAKKNITIHDKARLVCTAGALENIVVGNDASFKGNMVSSGDLVLQNQSSVEGDIILKGNVQELNNVNWSGLVIPLVQDLNYTIPENQVSAGSENIYLGNDEVLSLVPGIYGELKISARANLILSEGEYHFTSVYVEDDGKISYIGEAPVSLNIMDGFEVHSRALFSKESEKQTLKIFINGTRSINIGHDLPINATIIAPNAQVAIGDRVNVSGHIWANSIVIGNESSFVGYNTEFSSDEREEMEMARVLDRIDDATRFGNHGKNTNSSSKSGWIAESQSFVKGNHISFAKDNYFDNEATWSCWLYFDGITGRIFSSSDYPTANWKWNRTAEGSVNVVIGSVTKSIPVPENAWVNLAVVYASKTLRIYLNGKKVLTSSVGSLSNNATPWLGTLNSGLLKVDELRISNKARSDDWIRLDYITQKKQNEVEDIVEYTWRY